MPAAKTFVCTLPVDVYLTFPVDEDRDGTKHREFPALLESFCTGFDKTRPLTVIRGRAINAGCHAALRILRISNRITEDYEVSIRFS